MLSSYECWLKWSESEQSMQTFTIEFGLHDSAHESQAYTQNAMMNNKLLSQCWIGHIFQTVKLIAILSIRNSRLMKNQYLKCQSKWTIWLQSLTKCARVKRPIYTIDITRFKCLINIFVILLHSHWSNQHPNVISSLFRCSVGCANILPE